MLMRKNKVIKLLEKVLDWNALIEVSLEVKQGSEDFECNGMLGHEPGHYTVYGPMDTLLKTNLPKVTSINKIIW